MPELPEVEVVRRGLAEHAVGRRVRSAAVLHPRAARRQPDGAAAFAALVGGRELAYAARRGKFLWLGTDDPRLAVVAHLGMSGQFRVRQTGATGREAGAAGPEADGRHVRAVLDLADRELLFVDQRTFGWVAARPVVADGRGVAVPDLVTAIAPDPTEAVFDLQAVARAMRRHRVEIKRLLLDQGMVSGIGNIYADEALWRAGVHPRRRADRLAARTIAAVLQAATEVMAKSLAQGGTTFDGLYVNVNGRSGYFARGLSVYGREGQGCLRCGATIRRERFTNRSSHYCPRCQRPPRATH